MILMAAAAGWRMAFSERKIRQGGRAGAKK